MLKLFFIFYFFLANAIAQSTDSTFFDDFNTNSNNWQIDEPNNSISQREIKNGKYYFSHARQSDSFSSLIQANIDYNEDFCIETKIRQTAGFENFDYGFIWAYHGMDDYNFFGINTNLRFTILKFLDTPKNEKIVYPYSNKILAGNQWNVLKIERLQNILNFYINNSLVHSIANAHSHICSGNQVGFLVHNYKKIEIDFLKIKGKFKKINVIKNPNNGHSLENLGLNINSEYHELGPVISPDGNKLYFFKKNHPQNMGGRNQTDDIWYSERNAENVWTKAKNIGYPLNNKESNFVISVSEDNNSLMITNKYNANGSFKDIGISIASKDSLGKWQVPEDVHIADYFNANKYVSSSVSSDKKYLISSIESYNSNGNMDLYVSFKIDSFHYSKPINLGKIVNTYSNEISPFLAADNKTLYFSSYGHVGYGSADIFVTRRLDDTWQHWSLPENLGHEINSSGWEAYFTLPASGEYAYLVSNKASFGLSDVYRIQMAESAKPTSVLLVKGKVLNKKNNLPIDAKILIFDLQTDSLVGEAKADAKDGSYSIVLQIGRKYGFGAKKNGYYAINENVDVSNLKDYKEMEKNLFLIPIEIGQAFRMNNVFFEYDKSTLNVESKSELLHLYKLLISYPNMKIEIAGHTDGIGSEGYNLVLSQDRVNSVKNALIALGIDTNRLFAQGYGKSKPIAPNTTEEQKARNRRVEFIIKSL